MLKDIYYIKSLVATVIFLAIVLTVLVMAVYMTGIAGLAVLSVILLIFFMAFYRRRVRPAAKGRPEAKNIAHGIKERL